MNTPIRASSKIIPPDLVQDLRAPAADAEGLRQLTPAQWDIIQRQGWLRMLVPKDYGGQERNFPEALQWLEALAWTDGSVGWTVTLCAGAGWFAGFFDTGLAMKLFNRAELCVAGSGSVGGVAEKTANGYRISGQWPYATGIKQATLITANCLVKQEGRPLSDHNGNPLVRPFWFYPQELTLADNWNPIGLRATGSQGFAVQDSEIPEHRLFGLDPEFRVINRPLYRIPFLPLALATLAVNCSGMATRFLELAATALQPSPNSQPPWQHEEQQLQKTRQRFYEMAFRFKDAETPSEANASQLCSLSLALVQDCRNAVHAAFPFLGMTVVNQLSPINRVWRDFQTGSQHMLLRP